MKQLKYIFLLFFTVILTSCLEINSENPKEIFELWTGNELPKEIKLVNGKYWQFREIYRQQIGQKIKK